MNKLKPFLYIAVSTLVGLVALASFVAMVHALTVRDTLSAIESALGTGVLTILLAVIANRLFKAGWQQLRSTQERRD